MEAIKAARYDMKTNVIKATVVVGAGWGDEGKGKIVDRLGEKFDIVCRYAGGSNAGHTVVRDGKKFKFHLIPSGILNDGVICVLGNGMVISVSDLLKELDELHECGINDAEHRIIISDRAHIVFDFHKQLDKFKENARGQNALGTTGKGIGPAYASKYNREGIRISALADFEKFKEQYLALYNSINAVYPLGANDTELKMFEDNYMRIQRMVDDTVVFLHYEMTVKKRKVLVEGANASLLDIDFGSYPYVTSSSCAVGGVSTGLGIPSSFVGEVVGVIKAYMTRVGEGPFPTELTDDVCKHLQEKGQERGTTTGRLRRCGWFDVFLLKYVDMINQFDCLNLTKLDTLSGLSEIKVGVRYLTKASKTALVGVPANLSDLEDIEVEYRTFAGWEEDITGVSKFEDLPKHAQDYVLGIEELVQIPIKYIGVGPDNSNVIVRNY
jgi:adenylosuccinate synthase